MCKMSFVACLATSLIGSGFSIATCAEHEATNQLANARSPTEYVSACKLLFYDSTSEQLARLAQSDDPALSIAAGWESFQRTLLKAGPPANRESHLTEVDGFLRLVKERCDVELPSAWAASVSGAIRHEVAVGLIVRFSPDAFPRESRVEQLGDGNRRMHDGTIVRQTRDVDGTHGAVVTREGVSWSIPQVYSPARSAQILRKGNREFVAVYDAPPAFPTISCARSDNHLILWSTKAWGDGVSMSSSGLSQWAELDLVSDGNNLLVFGCSPYSVFIEKLDAKTGLVQWRFSSAYFRRFE